MRPNLGVLIKDEIVKRFEQLTKDEVRSYQLTAKNHHDKIEQLYLMLSDLHVENNKIRHEVRCYREEVKGQIENTKKELDDSFDAQRRIIRQKIKEIDRMMDSMRETMDLVVLNHELQSSVEHIEENIGSAQLDAHEEYKSLRQEISDLRSSLDESMKAFFRSESLVNQSINDRIDAIKRDQETHKIDAQGVLRELQVYKRTMFIIEKKLEHLTTLVDQQQKRCQCHKPV